MDSGLSIELVHINKSLGNTTLFRNFSASFSSLIPTAITGKNGSGKSTLLQMICGLRSPDKGQILFSPSSLSDTFSGFRHFSVSAPWHTPDFPLRVKEYIQMIGKLRGFLHNMSIENIMEEGALRSFSDVPLRGLSGGQMQRLKNSMAFFMNSTVLLLDEPLNHLDEEGITVFTRLCERYTSNRLVIVCSNHNKQEYFFCKKVIEI